MSAPATRRGILGATAALLAVRGTAAASAATTGDDAELLRLSGEFDRMAARSDELSLRYAHTVRIPDEAEAEQVSLTAPLHDLAERIADMHARTPAGLRAKARVLLFYTGYTYEGDPLWTNHDELLGWSLARDLCGDGAARPAGERT